MKTVGALPVKREMTVIKRVQVAQLAKELGPFESQYVCNGVVKEVIDLLAGGHVFP